VTIDGGGGSADNGSAQVRERTLAAVTLESLNEQLTEATAARIEAQSNARSTSGGARTNATLATLRQQRATAAAEYAELMARFEPGYPAAQALQRQITDLDSSISREEARIGRETGDQFRAASAREAALLQRVQALSGQVQGQRRDSIQYNIFQREADTNRQLYDALLQRYKEIGVAGVSANNIAVIDRADPPSKPSSPSLPLNMLLALGVGMIASVALVFFLEQTQEGLTDPTKTIDLLGLPLLGSVPKADADTDIVSEISDPKSDISEAYLAIRSSLAFTTDHGVPRSIMVVNSQPAEGKRTKALAHATVPLRVWQPDNLSNANLLHQTLTGFLDIQREHGVSNYLAGEGDLHRLIIPIGERLDFIAAGPSVPSAAELLSSDRMAHLVKSLQQNYDHVIVDSAPIIGLADAPLVSRTVEGVIFVVETGAVSVRGLRAALERLRSASAPLLGVILTKFDTKHADYGYGYSYQYKYGSRQATETRDA